MRGILAAMFLLVGAIMVVLAGTGFAMIFASPFEELLKAEINPHQGFKFLLIGLAGFYISLILFGIVRWWGEDLSEPESQPAE